MLLDEKTGLYAMPHEQDGFGASPFLRVLLHAQERRGLDVFEPVEIDGWC
jgi:hypothetical protein